MHMILGTCVKKNLLVAKEYTCSIWMVSQAQPCTA